MSWSEKNATDVAVDVAGNTVLATIDTDIANGCLVVAVTNTGGFAFDAFACEVQAVSGGPWVTIDVATPALPCTYQVGAAATLASLASAIICVNVAGIYAVRVSASANTTATTASVWSNLSDN